MPDKKTEQLTIQMLCDTSNAAAWEAWADYIDARFAAVDNWDSLTDGQTLCGRVFDHALARYRGKVPDEQAHHRAALAVSLVTELAAAGEAFSPGRLRIDNMTKHLLHISGGVAPDGCAFVRIFPQDHQDTAGATDRVEPFMVEHKLRELTSGYAFDLYCAFAKMRDSGTAHSPLHEADERFEPLTMLDADSLFRTLVCDEKWGVARATDAFMWAMAILDGSPMKGID